MSLQVWFLRARQREGLKHVYWYRMFEIDSQSFAYDQANTFRVKSYGMWHSRLFKGKGDCHGNGTGGWGLGVPPGSLKASRILSICNLKKEEEESSITLPSLSTEMDTVRGFLGKIQINTAWACMMWELERTDAKKNYRSWVPPSKMEPLWLPNLQEGSRAWERGPMTGPGGGCLPWPPSCPQAPMAPSWSTQHLPTLMETQAEDPMARPVHRSKSRRAWPSAASGWFAAPVTGCVETVLITREIS